jgi:hypothetical protein
MTSKHNNIVAQFTADYSGKFTVQGFMITSQSNFDKYLAFVNQEKFSGKTNLVLPFGDGESLTFKDFNAFKAMFTVTKINHGERESLMRVFKNRLWGVFPYAAEFEAKAK